MSKEVSIDTQLFELNINRLSASIEKLKFDQHANYSLEKTNISPFTDDLGQMVKAIEIIDLYRTLLVKDVQMLTDVGENMRQTDEHLSKQHEHNNGPQMIR
ncbi:TIGR04197 family type VII secretion effector [Oceanobacillus kimchii]|uniref:hypothetical protein n=1 Tax=Oceanobacillus kimchii TaxID=746691 RepID=UPI000344C3B6|nr:hypothetical protein [Oceanobacillus kimchii]MCT1576498.1 TIGR04197 family type VII secretion effector [Oceanobacillus kimchii]MCT2136134.1 TIGR04197 family type VII secretion effector [Oceanobacillus kimchii]